MTNPLKTTYAVFEVALPVTRQVLTCRPYLVKEERILLGAKESGKTEDITLAVQQIVRNVVLDKDFNVLSLNSVDLQHIFFRARAESVGNVIKVPYVCNNIVNEQECGGDFEFVLDLKAVKLENINLDIKEVPLTDDYMIKLRYPLYEKLRQIKSDDSEAIREAKKFQACIDYVASAKDKDAKEIVFDEMSLEDINDFIENLTVAQLEVINKWIEELPEMTLDTKAKCNKCGFEHEGHFDSLQSFF
jgi:hypothetical protein